MDMIEELPRQTRIDPVSATRDEMRRAIEVKVGEHVDRLIAADVNIRIAIPDAFAWASMNTLRLQLLPLSTPELVELAKLDGAEIWARFPGPTP
jgi:hypothetical protein